MKEDYFNRIKYFGIETQKRKFSEEADELRDAIVEYEKMDGIVSPPILEKQYKKHIAEEIADNLALLKQIQLYYGIDNEDIKKWLYFKNERTKQKIKNGDYNQKTF